MMGNFVLKKYLILLSGEELATFTRSFLARLNLRPMSQFFQIYFTKTETFQQTVDSQAFVRQDAPKEIQNWLFTKMATCHSQNNLAISSPFSCFSLANRKGA
jgi:hypothetical protein